MRITGRDLRKIINEELSRANKLITIREGGSGEFVQLKDFLQSLLKAKIITSKAIQTFDEMNMGQSPKLVNIMSAFLRLDLHTDETKVLSILSILEGATESNGLQILKSELPKIKSIIKSTDRFLNLFSIFIESMSGHKIPPFPHADPPKLGATVRDPNAAAWDASTDGVGAANESQLRRLIRESIQDDAAKTFAAKVF